jgi:hypothetical protein
MCFQTKKVFRYPGFELSDKVAVYIMTLRRQELWVVALWERWYFSLVMDLTLEIFSFLSDKTSSNRFRAINQYFPKRHGEGFLAHRHRNALFYPLPTPHPQ